MPRITWLKEFEGQLWARLELDHAPLDLPVHILTNAEIAEIKREERRKVWEEIESATSHWNGN